MATRRIGIGKVSTGKKKAGGKPKKPVIKWSAIKTKAQMDAAIQKANDYGAKLDEIDKLKAEKEKVKGHVAKLKTQFRSLK